MQMRKSKSDQTVEGICIILDKKYVFFPLFDQPRPYLISFALKQFLLLLKSFTSIQCFFIVTFGPC